MAPRSKAKAKAKAKPVKKAAVSVKPKIKNAPRITLEELDAISSSDDDDDDGRPGGDEWDAEALALRKAIQEGAFDHLLQKQTNDNNDDEEEDIMEVTLEDDTKDDDEKYEKHVDEGKEVIPRNETSQDNNNDDDDDDDDSQKGNEQVDPEEQDDSDANDEEQQQDELEPDWGNGKALLTVTKGIEDAKKGLPWAESFCIIAETPLPFGTGAAEGNPLDVHDDLKRELAFYNMALEAANMARKKCEEANVPFTRPEDFFAEMIKTDDHMAKVKDRLIFETKKIDAVAQRKSNKEQKLRSKEAHANKIAEKSKKKKEHFTQVDNWAKSAANNRGGALRDDEDQAYLGKMQKPGFKRQNANTKYGFGGSKGRFKQNSASSMNDMRDFNPKGNFAGGRKGKSSNGGKSSAGGKGGAGAERKGKRARVASRSK